MLRRVSLIIAVVIVDLSSVLWALYFGFDYGVSAFSGSSISGESGFGFLARSYLSICFWTVVFILGRLLTKREIISQILGGISFVFIFLSYRFIYLEKAFLSQNDESITRLLTVAFPVDLANVSLAIVLVGLQLFILFSALRSKREEIR